jgi:hypothetical protein
MFFIDISNKYYLQYVFNLTTWKMVIRAPHQRLILKVQKPVEVPI